MLVHIRFIFESFFKSCDEDLQLYVMQTLFVQVNHQRYAFVRNINSLEKKPFQCVSFLYLQNML